MLRALFSLAFALAAIKSAVAAPQLDGGLLLCLTDSTILDDATIGTTLDDLGASLVTCSADEVCTPLDTTIDDLPLIGTELGPETDGNLPIGVNLVMNAYLRKY